jgi:hypothetical protein
LACPGSVRLIRNAPEQEKTEYAEEGTAAHEIAARCLKKWEDAWEYVGWWVDPASGALFDNNLMAQGVDQEAGRYEVTDEMVVAVQEYLDLVRHDVDQYLRTTGDEAQLLVEQTFTMPDFHPDIRGTADAVLVLPGWNQVKVFDFKYGIGIPVHAENNDQLQYYAAGVTYKLDLTEVEEVELVISAPRNVNMDHPVSRWQLSVEELGEWFEARLMPGIRRTEEPDAPLVSGEHCRFCPARTFCPALGNAVEEALSGKDPAALGDMELSEAYEKIAQLRIWINAIESEVYNRLSHGSEVPAAKLVAKKANRIFGPGAEDAAREMYGAEAYENKLKSPAKLEKLPGGAAFVKKWAFAPETGLTVAPASDRRSTVKARTAEEAFANVEPKS